MDRHGMPETFEEYRDVIDTIKVYKTKNAMMKMHRDFQNVFNRANMVVQMLNARLEAVDEPLFSQEHKPDDINVHNGMGYKGD